MLRVLHRISTIVILLLICLSASSQTIGAHSAVSLNKFTLHKEATFTAHSNIVINENTLLEIISISDELAYDNYENQKFHWYKVRTLDGKEGYVFGDNIAIIEKLDEGSKFYNLHNSKKSFAPNYQNAHIWIASLKGMDAEDHGSAAYEETYLVITNNFGHCSFIRLANVRSEGEIKTDFIEFKDITSDGFEDVVLQTSAKTIERNFPTKYLEIFSFQSKELESVLEERLTVETYPSKTAPTLIKHFEIEEDLLRVSYIDFVDCENYCCQEGLKNSESNVAACLEHVTYSYAWNRLKNKFELFYEKTSIAPTAIPNKKIVYLFPAPGLNQTVGRVFNTERVKVYQQIEKFYKYGQTETIEIFFLIETERGVKAWIKSKDLDFVDASHADLLNEYYSAPPFYSTDWKPTVQFVNLKFTK